MKAKRMKTKHYKMRPVELSRYKFALLIVLCAAIFTGRAQDNDSFLFTGLTIYNGIGDVIQDGAIGVNQGIIDYVGPSANVEFNAYNEVVSKKGLLLYPGLIALNTTLGLTEVDAVRATRDFKESGELNPNVRAISAYNAESEIVETVLANGILFAQIAPRGGTIKGSTSVVKLKGHNWEDAAYRMDEGIVMDWPQMHKQKEKTEVTQGYGPNKTYEEELADIHTFFDKAKAYAKKTIPLERDLRMEAMRGIFDGTKRLYVTSDFIKEIREIIHFKRNYAIKNLTIVGGYDAWMAADLLKENDVSIILYRVNSLPEYAEDRVDEAYSLALKLATAGVKFSFQMDGDMETMQNRNLPFNVGTAIGYGLNIQTALSAVTIQAAEILGIADRTGSIEAGKEANFIITRGDIFDMQHSIIEEIFIQGIKTDFGTRQEELYKKYLKN